MKRILLATAMLFLTAYLTFAQTTYTATTYHQFNTSYGNFQLGPMNTGYCHMYTDRPNFMFNKIVGSMTGEFGSYNTSDLIFKTGTVYTSNGNTRMTIQNSTGNIGIGIASPEARLHVVGSAGISQSLLFDNREIKFRGDGKTHFSIFAHRVDGKLTFENTSTGGPTGIAGTVIMSLGCWGGVGIGTTDTKGYQLAVAGSMIAEKVVVKLQANWPDFVFAENHKLKSLSEIESYIKANKHLPEVPSASEVKEKGIDVGEMNTILLKKIEEITLLMIEQNKSIEILKIKVAELQNK